MTLFNLFLLQAAISGSVVSPEMSLAGATLTLTSAGGPVYTTTLDESGKFSLNAPPGVYELTLEAKRGRDTRIMRVPVVRFEDGGNSLMLHWPRTMSEADRSAAIQMAYSQGASDLAAGRYDDALRSFNTVLEHDTAQASAWASIALANVGMKRYEDALRANRMAIMFAPQSAAYRNNLGSTFFRMGRYAEAADEYKMAADLNPGGRGVYLSNAGAAYYALGNMAEAANAYRMATEDPNAPPSAWYYYGVVAQKSGDMANARMAFRSYLDKQPGGPYAGDVRNRLSQIGG